MRNTLQPLMAVSALVLAAMAGTGLPAAATTPSASAVAPRASARVPMPFDAAVAQAVRGAFDAADVAVDVSRVDVVSANAAQRELLAHGRVAIGASGWMPFEVSALYDVAGETAVAQRLSLGDTGMQQPVVPEALAAELSDEASRRLRAEFPGQPAAMALAGVHAREVGNGLLALEAVGRADFAGEGVAAAAVHALYDPRGDRWLRLQYRLDGDDTGESVAGL
jgi:hypothetical protein